MRRRESLALLAALTGAAASPRVAAQQFPGVAHRHDRVDPDYRMAFPRDFGAHPGFRTEPLIRRTTRAGSRRRSCCSPMRR